MLFQLPALKAQAGVSPPPRTIELEAPGSHPPMLWARTLRACTHLTQSGFSTAALGCRRCLNLVAIWSLGRGGKRLPPARQVSRMLLEAEGQHAGLALIAHTGAMMHS